MRGTHYQLNQDFVCLSFLFHPNNFLENANREYRTFQKNVA